MRLLSEAKDISHVGYGSNAALWFVANSISGPDLVSFSASDLTTILLDSGFTAPESTDLLPGLTGLVSARKTP